MKKPDPHGADFLANLGIMDESAVEAARRLGGAMNAEEAAEFWRRIAAVNSEDPLTFWEEIAGGSAIGESMARVEPEEPKKK